MFKQKLHIYLRHVHIYEQAFKARPDWFSIEACFDNLISTLINNKSDLNIDLTVMFDGTNESFNDDFMSGFIKNYDKKSPINIDIVKFTGGTDAKSFHYTIDYILKKNYSDNDWVYFLENDYLHVPDWTMKVSNLFRLGKNLDYVSLYDHNDKYLYKEYDDLQSKLFFYGNHHWRTTPSTCASFLVKMKTLKEDAQLIKNSGGDHEFFTALSTNKMRGVLSPIPGLSTHCMVDFLSPGIDWEAIKNSNN